MVKISSKTILASSLLTAVSVSPSCGKYDDGRDLVWLQKNQDLQVPGNWIS